MSDNTPDDADRAARHTLRLSRHRLFDDDITSRLVTVPTWTVAGGKLRRTFRFDDFVTAFEFMTRVATEAERLNHHPEWSNVYGTVRIDLVTHDAHGITELDFESARRMDRIAHDIIAERTSESWAPNPSDQTTGERNVMTGRIDMVRFESERLKNNPLGDPHVREIPVWTPPGYDADDERRYPVVFVLAGYSGHGRLMVQERTFSERLDQRLDRLTAAGELEPAIFCLVDGFTRLGGSQYVDSSATGAYEGMIVDDLVPFVDRHFRTVPGARGVVGKSSGGFGSMRLGLRHPDVFPVIACISGDSLFEYCYQPDFAGLLTALDPHDGNIARFIDAFQVKTQRKVSGHDFGAMNMIAMSACYSPDASAEMGIALPIDFPSGRRRDDVWRRWLEFDPVRMLERDPAAARRLHAMWIECGSHDEYRLLPGARVMADLARAADAPVEYHEFPDGHRGIDYRYDTVLPWLVRSLGETSQ